MRETIKNLKSVYKIGKDYNDFSDDQKSMLGNLVNNTLTLSAFFTRTISEDQE